MLQTAPQASAFFFFLRSVVPPSRTERKNQQNGFSLQVVNNTAIATYGKHSLTLDLGLRRKF